MKVRAIRLMDATRKPIERSAYVTAGKEYVVLAMSISLMAKTPASQAQVLLLTDAGNRSAGLFDLSDFEIIDDRPSRLWRIAFQELPGGRQGVWPSYLLRLEPESWLIPDFWETFYNEDPQVPLPDAVERFDMTVLALLDEAATESENARARLLSRDIGER